jgi:GT2 family glycosyltransferase
MNELILKKVTIVTVTFNSSMIIRNFIESCPESVAQIIVIDNCSSDNTVEISNNIERKNISVIKNHKNMGFGAACNVGLDLAETDFVLISNPDTKLSCDAIIRLIETAEASPGAGIVAPALYNEGRPVRSWDVDQLRRGSLQRKRTSEPWPEGPICADFVSGACMLFRRNMGFRFDGDFFLYFEDDDICASVRNAGRYIVLDPSAKVFHAGGASSVASVQLEFFKARHMAHSRLRYIQKHASMDFARKKFMFYFLLSSSKMIGHFLSLQFRKLNRDVAALRGSLDWFKETLTRRSRDRGSAAP